MESRCPFFPPCVLPPGGMTFTGTVPLSLNGFSFMLQALVLAPSPNTGNVFFTTTNGHEIQIM